MSAPQRGLSAAADHSLSAWADAGELRTADIGNVASWCVGCSARCPTAGARLALALLLGVLATGSTVALMGVSAWLLSRAAEHPPVLYLQVAVVGVRFFGIGRGVFRYLERLRRPRPGAAHAARPAAGHLRQAEPDHPAGTPPRRPADAGRSPTSRRSWTWWCGWCCRSAAQPW